MDKKSKMFALVVSWESSGLTRQAFCKEHGIKLSNFSYWRTRYLRSQSPKKPENFVKIKPSLATPIELIYPNGVKIVLPADSDTATLSSLIHLV